MDAVLELRDVHTFIGSFHILKGVSFVVQEGSLTALLGRNGAGKTTTLRTIMGLWPAVQGSIRFLGEELRGRPTYEIAALGIGYVPEHRAIFRSLTVEENLRLAERRRGDLARKADWIFHLFPDLKGNLKKPAGLLSGGQQQMLAIARALVPDNRLLLIDEPSEGLAPILVEQVMATIHRLREEMPILLVEQNFYAIHHLADRYILMEDGQVVRSGPMAELLMDREGLQRYLGVMV
ncbi:ABC transporter ATP-binding protein [Thermoflexus sp.]|uniref:ABC transporter ATP-binding protein n=1 Tax=Thermoflexus sp. TaxID=1969742 RepID=UPI00184A151C|nr:ABC transporter ATP-binding protein [Thermoflexus sp.]